MDEGLLADVVDERDAALREIVKKDQEIANAKLTIERYEALRTEYHREIAELKEKLSALKPLYLAEESWGHVLKDIVKRAKETDCKEAGE